MTVMVAEVWDALKSVGVSEEHARRAAEAVADARSGLREEMRAGFDQARREREAGFEQARADRQAIRGEMRDGFEQAHADRQAIRGEMRDGFEHARKEREDLRRHMEIRFERVEGELRLHRWMLGATFAGVVAVLLRLFFI